MNSYQLAGLPKFQNVLERIPLEVEAYGCKRMCLKPGFYRSMSSAFKWIQ